MLLTDPHFSLLPTEEQLQQTELLQKSLAALPKGLLAQLGMTEQEALEPAARFHAVDKDHNGQLQMAELLPLLTLLYEGRLAPENVRRMAAMQFHIADRDGSGM